MRQAQRTQGAGLALALCAVLLLALVACGGREVPGRTGAAEDPATAVAATAAAYCIEQGGRVITRTPTYGTNNAPANQLPLRVPRQFCNFESEPDDSGFQSQIEIDVVSLYSERPTLALLGYLEAGPPDLEGQPVSANPSTIHCARLGGSTTFGMASDASGGGWLKDADDETSAFGDMSLCMFPDGSAIDSWGITYRSQDTIRGVALETVARYQPDGDYPAIFGPSP